MQFQESYTFDDIVMIPKYSVVKSRKYPELSNEELKIPIVASPMNTVTELEMLETMAKMGGAAVLHRYMSIEKQCEILKSMKNITPKHNSVWVAVGVDDLEERIDKLSSIGVERFCIDVANGHNIACIEAVKKIKSINPTAQIMAGNVCTYDGAYRLAEAGATAIRAGIGSGSMCTTRVVTGHGLPQVSAILDCVKVKYPQDYGYFNDSTEMKYRNKAFPDIMIIADGGIRNSGDAIKALALGADAVMLGSLLAGSSDTPGEIFKDSNGELYKYYCGMASEAGRSSWFDRTQTAFVPEGESTRIAYKGSTKKILEDLTASIKVGMSYSGAMTLEELRKKAEFRKVSPAGYFEGTPHGLHK